jgi:transposase-like protein
VRGLLIGLETGGEINKSVLSKAEQTHCKSLLQGVYNETTYERVLERLNELSDLLTKRNRLPVRSLEEGLSETLLLHRLQMTEFSTSFATTNCIESLNSHLERTTHKVTYWQNSEQRGRWVGAGLIEAEERMRRVNNFERLNLLKQALFTAISNPNFN